MDSKNFMRRGLAIPLSLLFFIPTAPSEKRFSQTATHLSSPSSFNDLRQVKATLLKMSRNLHPNLIFPVLALQEDFSKANGDFSKVSPAFWPQYRALVAEWQRIEQPSEGWANQAYPELKKTAGQGTVLSITADLMLEHPELLGLGTGGLGVLKRDDTFAFGEALGNENYFLAAPFYSQWSHQEVTKEGEQKWIFHKVNKEKLPLEELGVIKVPYGFDEPVEANLSEKVAAGEIPPTSRYIYVKVWKAKMGKGNLLLLDTDIAENEDPNRYVSWGKAQAHFESLKQHGFKYDPRHDRDIMERIYPKDKPGEDSQRQRFKQYVVLSLGAFKAFALANEESGIEIPSVLHLNDPHVAPAAAKIYADPKYKDVLTIYTNHTLVAGAGTQWFHPDNRLQHQKENKWFHPSFFLPFITKYPELATIFKTGKTLDVEFSNAAETIVATKLPYGRVNAVNSDEHAEKLREQKPALYQNSQKMGNLVGVDNGVDPYWGRLFPFLWENMSSSQFVAKAKEWIARITAQDIEREKRKAKQQLVDYINTRYKKWLDEHFDGKNPIDPTKMVMVFAKRFNAYKRPNMVLDVSQQIQEALKNRPNDELIQIIFSGKANDNDETGKKLVKDIVAAQQEYKGEIRYSDGDNLFKDLISLKNKYQGALYYAQDKALLKELATFTNEYLNQSKGNGPEKLFHNLLFLISQFSNKDLGQERKDFFGELEKLSNKYRNRVRVLYLPDYHIEVSQKLLPAADFWLNTPQRHQEASGTSLLKALINAAILISTQSGAALHKAFFKHGENALLVDVGPELYEIPLGDDRAQEVENVEKKQLAELVVFSHNLYYRPEQKENLGRMRLAGMEKLYEASSFRQVEDQITKTVMPLLFRRDFKKEVVDIEASATGAFEVKVDLGKFPPKNAEVVVHYQDVSVGNGPWKNAELKRFRSVEGKQGQYMFKFKGRPPFELGNVKYVIKVKYKDQESAEVPSSLYNPEFDHDPWVNAIRLEEKFFFKPGHEVKPAGYGTFNEITIHYIPEEVDSSLSLAASI